MNDILLVGGGGHCRAVIDVIERTGAWNIAGIVERPDVAATAVMGYPIVGTDDELAALRAKARFALVTVGQIKTPRIRENLYKRLVDAEFSLPVIVSSQAQVARSATLGAGTIVMDFAFVGVNVQVGENAILNTRCLLEHDVVVGNHCHISTAAVLNGQVRVGSGSFIGSGALCREGVSIGSASVVAMGALVRSDIASGLVFKGHTAP